MGKQYSEKFKQKVVDMYKSGEYGGYPALAKKYGIKRTTVLNWIVKDKTQGNQKNDINHTRGRRKGPPIDYKERYEILKKYRAFLKAQREKK